MGFKLTKTSDEEAARHKLRDLLRTLPPLGDNEVREMIAELKHLGEQTVIEQETAKE